MARVRPSGPRMSSADAVTFSRQLPGQRVVVAALLAVALLAGLTGVRAALSWAAHPSPGASRAAGLEPADLVVVAADELDRAVATGGHGFTFEIVQHSTLHTRPDGPRVAIPHPDVRGEILGFTDEYHLLTLIEHGAVTPDGFWMEMRAGPSGDEPPDFGGVRGTPLEYGTIVRDGRTWRTDGDGWYETDDPPGIGLDPRTASLLPSLLRNATAALDTGTDRVGEPVARRIEATGRLADIPGVIAVDGEAFTTLVAPLEFAFDDDGRLVKLRALARNENDTIHDFLVETIITFAYPVSAQSLPEPLPRWTPPAAPTVDEADR